eukprot:CAMPEP_0203668306 /NCGR_PEP_ID=MMETSP0090-20130426/4968_1 /ASSEMBLY_ACC=CAM_ASM_001088 /TAXON_ID=426623 /ORGANISM="Chaetoceros affinis, Strain CCMP159" /LENGTH=308 /DNA_ID=CAMNT_0050532705 /DNA_START=99 /DNA_END=1021 /DNA_ORIENTATION=+
MTMAMVMNAPMIPVQQQQLQDMYSRGLLSRPRPNLYVLGTVHIGSKSARDAQLLIETVQPSTVVLEVPPSRLTRILLREEEQNGGGGGGGGGVVRRRKMTEKESEEERENDTMEGQSSSGPKQKTDMAMMMKAIQMLPALASEGLTKGGLSGLLFSTIIVWPSLVKRSTTSQEEGQSLPRLNEFEAAIFAARDVGATIIPADMEFEDLIQNVARSMNEKNPLREWTALGISILSESIGLRQGDPVRRRPGESMIEWENRRRNINTARASRNHGESSIPKVSRVLVEERDAEFARICMDILDDEEEEEG